MREDLLKTTWGILADFYGVDCPGDRNLCITIYTDDEVDDFYHVTEIDDEWAPANQIDFTELSEYAEKYGD